MSDFIPPEELYPLKFKPIYKERIWGGNLLAKTLGRKLPETQVPIGESWELSDRDDAQSEIVNGPLAGHKLGEVVKYYQRHLLGPRCQKLDRFPLLVKIIDAGSRLSLQVHPDEAACARIGGGAEPKTEMWYIIAAEKDAKILGGLSGRATKLQLVDNLDRNEVENLLQVYPSHPGDAYFIAAGTLHAIGGGNLLLEIQQNSDTTYRVSDWGRVDANGKSRELHVEKALESINFMNRTSPRIAGVSDLAFHNRKYDIVNMCPHFRVDDIKLAELWHDSTAASGSFHLLSAINQPFDITVRDGKNPIRVFPGETALVPFAVDAYSLTPAGDKTATVIKTTL